ncbi:MAG: hypothetical protein HC877_07835 [Thioploca sp.]|nr:hypothetical protein [Thioploca sp.]
MPSANTALDHASQGEIYRMMGIQGQVQDPKKPFLDAIKEFDQAIQANEKYAWAYAHRGAAYFQLALSEKTNFNQYKKALDDFDKAISLNAGYSWAYAQKGETHRWLGIKHFSASAIKEFESAIEAFNKAIELAPDYAWAYAHRSAARRFLFRNNGGLAPNLIQDSIHDLNKAIQINTNYAWAYAYLAVFHRLESASDKAYEDLEEAARLYPDVFYNYIEPESVEHKPHVRHKKGFMLFSAEQINQAQQILAQNPREPFALYLVTLSKYSQGGFAAIKEELNKGREMKIF